MKGIHNEKNDLALAILAEALELSHPNIGNRQQRKQVGLCKNKKQKQISKNSRKRNRR
jgi:hypothetical protein